MTAGKDALRGKRIAFTGRLASLTRKAAADLVRAYGGAFSPKVDHGIALVVVGQEGWPLQKDGRLTAKLQKAQSLKRAGFPVEILQEREFLCRLGLDTPAKGMHRLYTSAQLTSLLGISRNQLQSWIDAGLIQAVQTINGISCFDYRQVSGAKTLSDLTRAGVKPSEIRKSLEQLRSWLPDLDEPLAQLATLESNGKLLMRVDGGLVEPGGQRQFDFAPGGEPATVSIEGQSTGSVDWFQAGCEYEEAGRLEEAEESYRKALLVAGPDPDISFNLANVLFAIGRSEQAVERLYQALEMDGRYVPAWNNLGIVLSALGRWDEARRAWERALQIDEQYADAHFNLADMLDELGEREQSRRHWQAYARLDPTSTWGRHAKYRDMSAGQRG
jgi:tetratricopeptide (TPR) repeat protein